MGFISRDIVPLKGHKPHMGYISRDSVPLSAINLSLQAIFRTASRKDGGFFCSSQKLKSAYLALMQASHPELSEAWRSVYTRFCTHWPAVGGGSGEEKGGGEGKWEGGGRKLEMRQLPAGSACKLCPRFIMINLWCTRTVKVSVDLHDSNLPVTHS